MKLTIKDNFPQVQRTIDALGKQARFAAAVALTKTAQDIRSAEVRELQRALDRPTPYTLRSLFLKPATKASLEAKVWIKDDRAGSGTPAVRYLLPQIEGGERSAKRFEQSLRLAGYLPPGWLAMPGAGARLDQYGNVSRGQIIEVLSQLRITIVAGFTRNMSFDSRKAIAAQRRAGGRYFAVRPGALTRLKPGIYQRELIGNNVSPVFVFVRGATYRKRVDFFGVAEKVAAQKFPGHFKAAIERALATQRVPPRG